MHHAATLSLWALRAILTGSAVLKLIATTSSAGGLPSLVAGLELCVVAASFAPEPIRSRACLATLCGFLGSALMTLILLVVDPASGQASCGCLGKAVELQRNQALILQGVVISLAWVASLGSSPAREPRPL